MTCKDCVSFNICAKKGRHFATHEFVHGKDINKQYVTNIETKCNDFKDKNKIIELPRNVGDIVFLVVNGKIKEVLVDGFEINPIGMKIILHNDLCKYLPDEEIFFSKEEAENKLKANK